MPTFDVYSDFSLLLAWIWNLHWRFAIGMSIPVVLQFVSTIYKWIRLEKTNSKRWTWIPLILQFWPQWMALRIINLDRKDTIKAEEKKKELQREVTYTEPFLEAFTSILILTVIWMISLKDNSFTDFCIANPEYKECPEYNNTMYAPPEYCEQHPDINRCAVFSGPGGLKWYIVTYCLSIYSCIYGITFFLMNGPFSVLSGLMTMRVLIAMTAVGSAVFTKISLWVTYCYLVIALDSSEEGNKIENMALHALVLFGLLILPNLLCSFISIASCTGLNKNFFKVIARFPASWMLPVCTYFVIGPQSLKNRKRRHLGLSKFFTMVNMIISLIMSFIMFTVIVVQSQGNEEFSTPYVLLTFIPMMYAFPYYTYFLISDTRCFRCCPKCWGQSEYQIFNVNKNEFENAKSTNST